MKTCTIKSIEVEAIGGATLHDCLIEALTLAYEHGCDVEVVHNKTYHMTIEDVRQFIAAVTVRS